jgi:predicted amidohydrolase YtcJ
MTAASRLFTNGKVFTGTGEHDFASAFRVTGDEVAWVGDAAQVRGEPAVDLGGATVVPGLLDLHTHPSILASSADAADLLPPAVGSLAALLDRLRAHPALGQGPDRWITGRGYDDPKFPEGRGPLAADLDRVSATQPIMVWRCDGHTGAANTVALERAGITAATPDPPGARFERDEAGRPTGGLIELNALAAITAVMPAGGDDAQVGRLVGLNQHFLSRGIVAVCDMRATGPGDPLATFRAAQRRGLRPRCRLYRDWAADGPLPDLRPGEADGRIRIGGVKLFMDGAYSNRTAWTADPYPGSGEHGLQTLADADARAAASWARRNGVQVAIHAMGDRALRQVLDLFGADEPWLGDRPSIRLEHATLMAPDLITDLESARMSFGIATHTVFYFAEYDAYERNLSPDQARVAYPIRDLYRCALPVALSSDCPATAWSDADNVFVSVQAAVRRRAYNGADIGQHSSVTVPQALLLYTGRAREVADVGPVGCIAPGFEASFAVLDRDVFTVPPDEIDQVRVAQTWVGGELAYDAATGVHAAPAGEV